MTQIPQSFIDAAIKAKACQESIDWLTAQPRTVTELVTYNPSWALWGFQLTGWSDLLTDEQFDWCRKEWPGSALQFCSARLTDEQFDWCRKECPRTALEFGLPRCVARDLVNPTTKGTP